MVAKSNRIVKIRFFPPHFKPPSPLIRKFSIPFNKIYATQVSFIVGNTLII